MKHVLTIVTVLIITIACLGCVGAMVPSQSQIVAAMK